MYPNKLFSYIPTIPQRILEEKYLKISFSQNGEDDFIRGHFWNNILEGYKGTYLDIGCYNETLYSNTKLLSLMGWSGLAVDANPDLENLWVKARPQDSFLNLCIASSDCNDSELEFFRFGAGAMSTANPERAKQLIKEGWQLLDRVRVPAIRLTTLAEKIIDNGFTKPDIVSIDIEMVNFLDDLPEFLRQLLPSLLCMECVTESVNLRTLFSSQESISLDKAGYEPIALIGGNIFAVQKQTVSPASVF